MIVVEGCDNCGKTTLVETLAKEFHLPVIKSYRPSSEDEIVNFHCWANAAPRMPIMDRHPAISDFIYGPILRGHTPSHQVLQRRLFDNNPACFLILCDIGIDAIKASYHEREQLKGTHENLDILYERYLRLPIDFDFVYDYHNPRALPALVSHLIPSVHGGNK